MKHILSLFIAILISTTVFSQLGTTAEEYNFLTQEIELLKENSLDFKNDVEKKGYKLKFINHTVYKFCEVEMYEFRRINTEHIAAHFSRLKVNDTTYYLCFARNNRKLTLKNLEKLASLGSVVNKAVDMALHDLSLYYLQKSHN